MHGVPNRNKLTNFNEGKLCLHATTLTIGCWKLHHDGIQRCIAMVTSPPPF
jgi:hypothetical protein